MTVREGSVTQRDNEKLEASTAPNPSPLPVEMIGNILTDQRGKAHRRLVHNQPTPRSDFTGAP